MKLTLDKRRAVLHTALMTTYRLYTASATEHTVTGRCPTKALRQLCKLAGLELEKQSGRYGSTTDGQHVAALRVEAGRVRYADHGTTRV